MSSSTVPEPRTIPDGLVVAIFAAVLVLPATATFWYRGADSENVDEKWKKILSGFSLNADEFREFRPEFEEVFSENFGFRREFVETGARVTIGLFGESPVNRITIGNDNWFFLATPGHLDDFRGLRPLKEDELDTWVTALDVRREYLADAGIPFLFAIPPNKHVIYPDYVPGRFNRVNLTTHTDALLETLEARDSSTEPLDLKASQLEARARATSYYPHDTHWAPLGAYHAYLAIVERLQEHFPGMEPLGEDEIRWEESAEDNFDLGRLIGLRSMPDLDQPLLYYVVKNPTARFMETKPDDVPALTRVEYAPDGVPSYRVMRSPGDKPRGVLFHDSFSCTVIPLLGEHFSELMTIWSPFDQRILEEVVEGFRPDVVIEERLDRFLQHMPLYTPEISARRFREAFEEAAATRVKFAGAEGLDHLEKRRSIDLEPVEDGVRMTVKSASARFDLPLVPVEEGEAVLLSMTLWRPEPGVSRIKWQKRAKGNDEPESTFEISFPAGESKVYLAFPEVAGPGDLRLRFYPDVEGEMILRDAEVRVTSEPGPRIALPREAPYPQGRRW